METNSRKLYDHKVSELNRKHVEVFATDERNDDGAHHSYQIDIYRNDGEVVETCKLNFQNGGLQEVGPNGITEQALLAVVLDRLRGFNSGPYSSRENSIAITKIEESLLWLQKRADDRARRGVEGQRVK